MLKWISPTHWGKLTAMSLIRFGNRIKAKRLFNKAKDLILESQNYSNGPLKEACINKARELAIEAYDLRNK